MAFLLSWTINKSVKSIHKFISTLEKARENAKNVLVKCSQEQAKINSVKTMCRKVDALSGKLLNDLK